MKKTILIFMGVIFLLACVCGSEKSSSEENGKGASKEVESVVNYSLDDEKVQ